MSINHAQLRAFHAVAGQGSFTKAAAALHVTQPTLSGQVKELEERYGVKLFERRGRGIELTELGRSVYTVTQRLFGLEIEIEQILAAAQKLASGELRVAADAPYHVISLLASFNRRYPGVRLSITFGNSEQLLRALLARRCDIAVLPDIRFDERIYAIPLHPDRLVVFVHRSHPWATRRSIQLKELENQRLIMREIGSTTRAIFERALTETGVTLHDTLEIGSREGVREAVAAGLGVGVVSESEFNQDSRLHALRVRDAELENVEYVACLQERRPIRVVCAFFELLSTRLASVPDE